MLQRAGGGASHPLLFSELFRGLYTSIAASMLFLFPFALRLSNLCRCIAHTRAVCSPARCLRAAVSDTRLFTPLHFAGTAIISVDHLMRASCASCRYEG